jgi:hypothetical protein
MLQRLRNLFNKSNPPDATESSLRVDQQIVERFESVSDNPFLVSFPRTGSHWLRMMLELYFQRPTLVRAFYFPESQDFLLRHHHDMDLHVERRNVIYLYREPVATIYSQLRYENEPLDAADRIAYWTDLYGRHLDKWLVQENFTTKKTVVTYEGLMSNLATEFAYVTAHFGRKVDSEHLHEVAAQVTKNEVKSKTVHDEKVVTMGERYEISREAFREQQASYVWACLFKDREHLQQYFHPENGE